ncbi:MAG: DUF1729 domain-containing protein, partial [Myxococcales bacterium]|nr:DUF1729 domain-containing protein [Myxococcales bacterium]
MQRDQIDGRQVETRWLGGSCTAAGGQPRALVERLSSEGPRAALTFAGQGVDALAELRAVLAICPQARPLVAAASTALADLSTWRPFRWSGLVDHGIDPLGWTEESTPLPPAAYLSSTLVSQPLIFTAQIARYRALYEQGLGRALRRGGVSALTGHSQGVMAALLVAESAEGRIQTERFAEFVRYFAWQGLHMAQSAERVTGDGEATPMAAVSGLPFERLAAIVARLGEGLPAAEQVHVTLHNTRTRFVLSGAPARLGALHGALEKVAADEAAARKAGRLGGSPLRFTWEWLTVGGPFHSPLMAAGRAAMARTLGEIGLRFDARKLRLPVLDPADGTPLNEARDLAEKLLDSQFIRPVRWRETLRGLAERAEVDFILDCGPGDGVARLSAAATRGAGVPVVALCTTAGQESLFTVGAAVPKALNYKDFAPKVAALPDGRRVVDNRYTRATGQAPIVLPGMTPTTVDAAIVCAAANAGFTAELAGGGQVTADILDRRLAEVADKLAPGAAVCFNALYLDPYLWNLHLGSQGRVLDALRGGAPICGVTVSAGVPPVEEAVALLDSLVQSGCTLNAFKPGTAQQVTQVLRIAEAAPHHRIFVHLEGGKAGGHHSWEDLDALLLETYPRLRAAENVILCVGGGIGHPERAAALLTGTWALRYGEPAMPVDAVLLGTVTMACAEATTSPQVKRALVDAAGTVEWVAAGGTGGGVTSGKSSLDADIHYLDNAAARCGRLLDQVAGDAAAVAARREAIIAALAGTAKPYFGDLETMTWAKAVDRLVELTAVGRDGAYEDGRWPDRSFRARAAAFIRMAEARLAKAAGPSLLDAELRALDAPEAVRDALIARFPQAATTRVHPADARTFVREICTLPGKPVNFVPVIDADVRRWYKADSLWQAHDDRYPADAVLVIPGPEAVAGIERVDEPVAELLARFEAATVAALSVEATPRARRHGADHLPVLVGVRPEPVGGELCLRPGGAPGARNEQTDWFAYVAARFSGPVAELFGAGQVTVGRRRARNPVRAVCRPFGGSSLWLDASPDGELRVLTWRSADKHETAVLRAVGSGQVEWAVYAVALPDTDPPVYRVRFDAAAVEGEPAFVVAADAERDALRDFYLASLFGAPMTPTPLFEEACARVTVDAARARAYARLTGAGAGEVPLNYAFSLVWEPLFRVLADDELASGLLRLVHLDQRIELGAAWPPKPGDELTARARVVRVEDVAAGRTIIAEAMLSRGGVPCAKLRSSFFVRGDHGQTPWRTRAEEGLNAELLLPDPASAAFLG